MLVVLLSIASGTAWLGIVMAGNDYDRLTRPMWLLLGYAFALNVAAIVALALK